MIERRDLVCSSRRFRFRNFLHAINGVRVLIATQPNARFHAAATVGVIAVGGWLHLAALEWAAIVGAMTLVWVAEGLNTAVEFVVDLVSPDYHKLAGWAKDVAAGAVLLASVGAVVIGMLIFVPKLLSLR